eukprot:378672-Alexandrium_andersonii.AAC.1
MVLAHCLFLPLTPDPPGSPACMRSCVLGRQRQNSHCSSGSPARRGHGTSATAPGQPRRNGTSGRRWRRAKRRCWRGWGC